ncbi:MAG: hypothetical protein GF375_04335 [Candidatus Omnitrophica bacterium]|nr:hypothetical protein [Candidatus Omnitrophota bacterium]
MISPAFVSAGSFIDGVAAVKDGFIDRKGKYVYKDSTCNFYNFSGGLGPYSKDSLFGFIDANGAIQIGPSFRYAQSFNEGVAPVMGDNEKWFYIDKTGRKVSGDYDWAFPFSGGIAAVCTDGKFNLINSKMEVNKLGFSYIGVMKEGLIVFAK